MNDLERRMAYGGPLASDEILRMMNNPPSTEPIILAGKRFGKLTPLFPTERTGNRGSTLWVCRCACGRQTLAAYGKIYIGIEGKTDKGRLDGWQELRRDQILEAGGLWTLARSVEDVETVFDRIDTVIARIESLTGVKWDDLWNV